MYLKACCQFNDIFECIIAYMSNECPLPIALFVCLWFTSCSQTVKTKTYISKTKTTKKKLALSTTTNLCDPTMPPIKNLENAKKMADLHKEGWESNTTKSSSSLFKCTQWVKLSLTPPWENPRVQVKGEELKIYYKNMQSSPHKSSLHTLTHKVWLGKNAKPRRRLLI